MNPDPGGPSDDYGGLFQRYIWVWWLSKLITDPNITAIILQPPLGIEPKKDVVIKCYVNDLAVITKDTITFIEIKSGQPSGGTWSVNKLNRINVWNDFKEQFTENPESKLLLIVEYPIKILKEIIDNADKAPNEQFFLKWISKVKNKKEEYYRLKNILHLDHNKMYKFLNQFSIKSCQSWEGWLSDKCLYRFVKDYEDPLNLFNFMLQYVGEKSHKRIYIERNSFLELLNKEGFSKKMVDLKERGTATPEMKDLHYNIKLNYLNKKEYDLNIQNQYYICQEKVSYKTHIQKEKYIFKVVRDMDDFDYELKLGNNEYTFMIPRDVKIKGNVDKYFSIHNFTINKVPVKDGRLFWDGDDFWIEYMYDLHSAKSKGDLELKYRVNSIIRKEYNSLQSKAHTTVKGYTVTFDCSKITSRKLYPLHYFPVTPDSKPPHKSILNKAKTKIRIRYDGFVYANNGVLFRWY